MNRLDGIEAKLDRAKTHIDDLSLRLDAFYRTGPYQIAAKRDEDAGRLVYYVASVVPVPFVIPAIAGDALQCLRSALDHAAHALVCIGKASEGPFFYVYYPIFNSSDEYRAKRSLKVSGVRNDALGAIDATRPYKDGNALLWQLEKLNIADKHRLLIAAGGSYQSFDVMASIRQKEPELFPGGADSIMSRLKVFLRPVDSLFPLKPGDELFNDISESDVNPNMEFRLPVSTHEPHVLGPVPLGDFVRSVYRMVVSVIDFLTPFLSGAGWPNLADLGY